MLYNYLKVIHITSASMVLTSMSYCYYLWRTLSKNKHDVNLLDRIQNQTWLMIIPFGLVQLGTGFTMISLQHYDYSQTWIVGSVISFMTVIGSWFGFIYFLLLSEQAIATTKTPSRLSFYRHIQGLLLLLCAAALLCMIFFMANKIMTRYG